MNYQNFLEWELTYLESKSILSYCRMKRKFTRTRNMKFYLPENIDLSLQNSTKA